MKFYVISAVVVLLLSMVLLPIIGSSMGYDHVWLKDKLSSIFSQKDAHPPVQEWEKVKNQPKLSAEDQGNAVIHKSQDRSSSHAGVDSTDNNGASSTKPDTLEESESPKSPYAESAPSPVHRPGTGTTIYASDGTGDVAAAARRYRRQKAASATAPAQGKQSSD